jgi:hypothetical protein
MKNIFLAALATTMTASAFAASPSDAFFPLKQAIVILANSSRGESFSPQTSILGELTQEIEQRFIESGIEVPDDYEKTLSFDASQIRAASRGNGNTTSVEVLADVINDLKAKDAVYQGGGLTAPLIYFSPLIQVSIVTTKSGKREDGYHIHCNPRRYSDIGEAMFIFNKPSSPTSYRMPPGMYMCFASLSGSIRGKQEVSVGLDGGDHEDVVLQLP